MRLLALAVISTTLVACGGGGGGSSPPPAPTVSLTASATDVATNGSVTLSWTATNVASCAASGAWTDSLGATGSRVVTVSQPSTYSLACTGAGGSASSSVTVTAWNAVSAAISADATDILANNTATVTWSSQNARSCTGADALTGTLATDGSQTTAPLTTARTFSLSCSNPVSSANASVTVNVSTTYTFAVTVRFQTPGPPVLETGYSLTDIGVLSGGDYAFGTAMNNAGAVIGYAGSTVAQTQTSFLWNGVMRDFSSLPGGVQGGGTIHGINNAGEIVGSGGPNGAFSWISDVRKDLGFFPSSGAASSATSVNDGGQIAGWGYAGPGSYHAWLWQNNAFTDLGTLGGPQSQANSIGNSGVIVGHADLSGGTQHAFRWQSGAMTDLGVLVSNSTRSSALDVNDSNVIVGFAEYGGPGSSTRKAVVWVNNAATVLPTLSGAPPLYNAEAINSTGQIIGNAYNAAQAQRAVLWQNGQIVDLTGFVLTSDPLKSFVTLYSAVDINDPGYILALGVDSRRGGGSQNYAHSYIVARTVGTLLVPDWANAEEKPVPFVSVELQNASGAVVQKVFANAQGVAIFTGLDPAVSYTPVVRSQAKDTTLGLDISVVDNTDPIDTSQPTFRLRYAPHASSGAAYKPDKRASQSLLLTAPDGWDAETNTLVDSMRIAGPFALLASAVTEAQIISVAIGSAVTWRPLTILWSTKNKGGLSAPPNNYDLGLVTDAGGFYNSGHKGIDSSGVGSGTGIAEDHIFVSGDQTFEAMDIYPYVMAHEMGHFSQLQFSTLKSPSGSHAHGDYEDQTLAWVEGNASGIAAVVLNTPLQNRLFPFRNRLVAESYDVAADRLNGSGVGYASVGWYSEDTVTRLMWQLYDPAGAIKLAPAAVLAPMFTSAWKSGPWLNTLWAFLSELKQLNAAKAIAIDTLADPLNVTSTANDVWGSAEAHSGNRISRDVLPPYTAIRLGGPPVTVCSIGQPLEYNKAGNVRYLRLTGDGNTHTLTVQGPAGTVPLLQRGLFTPGSSQYSTSGILPLGDTVISVGDCAVGLSQFSSDVTACNDPAPSLEQCWTVTLQ